MNVAGNGDNTCCITLAAASFFAASSDLSALLSVLATARPLHSTVESSVHLLSSYVFLL